jgi:hypothetical protein
MAKALLNNWIIILMIAIAIASFWAVMQKKDTVGTVNKTSTAIADTEERIALFWDIFPKKLVTVRLLQ